MIEQNGYTTTEALAALAILGLAMSGLLTSLNLIGAGQDKARARLQQASSERAADQGLERLLAAGAPFRSDAPNGLVGDATRFDLTCAEGRRCQATLANGRLAITDRSGARKEGLLRNGENAHFVYIGSYSASSVWPPLPLPAPAPGWQTLTAVAIQSQSSSQTRPLALAKVWRQQRADCEYDVVAQDCRRTSP